MLKVWENKDRSQRWNFQYTLKFMFKKQSRMLGMLG